ncbi:ABC transporter permease [Luteimicrobium album]|uniref:Xylose transport system permease protein XylH n=1 Tax=Luteimicrobium album TaxID=1054550 RepID=A0ABQ6HYF4_9MICO|nr:sugar ABC transporter permease [Luteimicrobium album]GMA22575.1 ABC transporter permease [Luteimicrobium album]
MSAPLATTRPAIPGGPSLLTRLTTRVRHGELGPLPVVVGLVIIWAVFGVATGGDFFGAENLVNLAVQCAGPGLIAVGVVLVLLLGEIDLSVGSVSGLGAAVLGVGLVNHGWPFPLVLAVALGAGAVIGLLYGFLFARFGVPSFVLTLAGLLTFLGVQLALLNTSGSINLPADSFIVRFSLFEYLLPWQAYLLAVLGAGGLFLSDLRTSRRRERAGLASRPLAVSALKAGLLLAVLLGVAAYLATDRGTGVSFAFLVVVVVVVNFFVGRTRWGRSIYAVGGNVEAARRAGVRVHVVYLTVFMLCSVFAVVGGLVSAGSLTAVTLSAGTGDVNLNAIAAAVIGGTSLFGGRGSAWSALLGVIVVQSIANGLSLMNFQGDAPRFIVTGVVLLLAVIVDSVSRRSRQNHGTV